MQRLRRMANAVRHRGPDGDGFWSSDRVGLAHRRLRILDLSDSAWQPMSDKSGRVHLVFNGEIYNFRALRDELAAQGARFESTGDTEVLLQAYLAWGDKAPEKLTGMFAFAIYDERDDTLFLARDRFGEKPLFFHDDGREFVFASEIKALIQWPEIAPRPDLRALHRYLTYQYAPAPQTAFEGIQCLPPGCRLRITRTESATPSPKPYWRLPDLSHCDPTITPLEAAEQLRAHLARVVDRQRASDVPLGVFLSGGIDSSAISWALNETAPGPIKAFSVGFEDASYDELWFAREVASQFGFEHHEHFFQYNIVGDLAELDAVLDEPFADPAILPALKMSRLARNSVGVALSGDGGDEALLGYPRYVGCKLANALDFIPTPLRRWLALLGDRGSRPKASVPMRFAMRLLLEMGRPERLRYASMISFFSDGDRPGLYADALQPFLAESVSEEIAAALDGDGPVAARTARFDLERYVPDALMTKTDRAAMSVGLEVRCPFLDHELVEFCSSLPASLRLPGANGKAVLIDAMEGLLPEDVLVRGKMGLGVPLATWLRTDLWEVLTDSLSEERIRQRGLFDYAAVSEMLNDIQAGGATHQYRLWALLRLERWFSTWIDAPNG